MLGYLMGFYANTFSAALAPNGILPGDKSEVDARSKSSKIYIILEQFDYLRASFMKEGHKMLKVGQKPCVFI